MTLKLLLGQTGWSILTPSDNPDVLKAQCAAVSGLVPMMSFILATNSWVLAARYVQTAPL
jgi:predicted signal transduction protein with EAL and GGDEF domain